MTRSRVALVLLTLVCPLLLLSSFLEAPVSWLAAPLICALPILLIMVGAGSRQPDGRWMLIVWLLLTGSWLALLWLSHAGDLTRPAVSEAWLVVAIMLAGLGLGPLLLTGWIFLRWVAAADEIVDGEPES